VLGREKVSSQSVHSDSGSFFEDKGVQQITFSSTDLVIPDTREAKRQKTAETLLNILEGRIRNPNTRNAYKVAWKSFFAFCSEYKRELDTIQPYHVGMWLKRHPGGISTQRQHLAAVRLLFDHLLEQGVVTTNPAARAKPPRQQRERSHTPAFECEEITALLGAIKLDSIRGIRDKALFSVLAYSWSRVSALVGLKVGDYYTRKGERWLRLEEKRGKIHEVPVHSKAREAIDQWLEVSGLESNPDAPLFPAFAKDKKTFARDKTNQLRPLDRTVIWRLVQTRTRACGIKKRFGPHSFRASGITEYINQGGSLEMAQRIAGHSQLSTTKIYDRSGDRLTIAEIERISFEPEVGGC
jgi:integrase/recombinase XerD